MIDSKMRVYFGFPMLVPSFSAFMKKARLKFNTKENFITLIVATDHI